jgi:hypothetical protein
VKFFVWLLVQYRIHTCDVLLRKTIIADDGADFPLRAAKLESPSHMALHCPVVAPFWTSLGVLILRDTHDRGFYLLQLPSKVAVSLPRPLPFSIAGISGSIFIISISIIY